MFSGLMTSTVAKVVRLSKTESVLSCTAISTKKNEGSDHDHEENMWLCSDGDAGLVEPARDMR